MIEYLNRKWHCLIGAAFIAAWTGFFDLKPSELGFWLFNLSTWAMMFLFGAKERHNERHKQN